MNATTVAPQSSTCAMCGKSPATRCRDCRQLHCEACFPCCYGTELMQPHRVRLRTLAWSLPEDVAILAEKIQALASLLDGAAVHRTTDTDRWCYPWGSNRERVVLSEIQDTARTIVRRAHDVSEAFDKAGVAEQGGA